MSNANHARYLHRMLDLLAAGKTIGTSDFDMLRRALPEKPEQKTLAEITRDVYDAWGGSDGNDWSDYVFGELETWLDELHTQLKGLETTTPAHPEFLETEADYENAPFGTIVVGSNYYPWTKAGGSWLAYGAQPRNDFGMRACRRYVLRWGDK